MKGKLPVYIMDVIEDGRLRIFSERVFDDIHHLKYTYCLFPSSGVFSDKKKGAVEKLADKIVGWAKGNGAVSEVVGWDWCYWSDKEVEYDRIDFLKIVISDPVAKIFDDLVGETKFERTVTLNRCKGKFFDRSHLQYSAQGDTCFSNDENCILYARCDHDRYRWWNTWWDGKAKQTAFTDAIGNEISYVMFDVFKLLPRGVSDICRLMRTDEVEHLSGSDECNMYYYGREANYWIRMIARHRDYNIYLKAYKKSAE